jgi:cytochrome c5
MKRTVRVAAAAGCFFVLVGAGAKVGAQTAAPNPAEQLTQAKAVFERACGACHSLDKPLSKTFDKAGWEKTVERMRTNGAKVTAEEAAQVVAYLLAKNTFEAKCSACHPTDKPLGKSKSAAEWQSTVQRMSAKKPGHIAEAEAADIAAYLSLVRPVQK